VLLVRLRLLPGTRNVCRACSVLGFFPFGSYRKVVVMCWAWLFLAIVLEVAATLCMKLSDGFSRSLPTAAMIVLYALSFWPTAIAMRQLDIAVVYAVWSAVGTAAISLAGVVLFRETVSPLKITAIALIVIGVVALNLSDLGKRPSGNSEKVISPEIASAAAPSAKDVRSHR